MRRKIPARAQGRHYGIITHAGQTAIERSCVAIELGNKRPALCELPVYCEPCKSEVLLLKTLEQIAIPCVQIACLPMPCQWQIRHLGARETQGDKGIIGTTA